MFTRNFGTAKSPKGVFLSKPTLYIGAVLLFLLVSFYYCTVEQLSFHDSALPFFGVGSNSSIGLLIVNTKQFEEKFRPNLNTWKCYATRHNYRLFIVDIDDYPECKGGKNNFFFQRHCIADKLLYQVDWLFSLDGDTVVADMSIPLEKYIDENYDIILAMREHCGEIQGGLYLIRNTEWAHQYLQGWIDSYLPDVLWHNRDNGALHMYLLGFLRPEDYPRCRKEFDICHNHTQYDRFVGCVMGSLGAQREFPEYRLKILRRMHTFSRDLAWFPYIVETDFVLHGIKEPLKFIGDFPLKTAEDLERCTADGFQIPIANVTRLKTKEARKELAKLDFHFVIEKQPPLGFPDIYKCWPHCETSLKEWEVPVGAVESWGRSCLMTCVTHKKDKCPVEGCTAKLTNYDAAHALEEYCNRVEGYMKLLRC
eukprot:GCRY01004371.1.p1 GENE.GCRY01004371.1~~GCRY01004371.1.p1  ORF type:complete len:424 (+),score=46.05 GCRY01004371.1:186-1457(+)